MIKTTRAGLAAGALALSLLVASPALAAATVEVPPRQSWSFAGPFGTFDQGQLQRGYKVYREVCASCHGMDLVHFRNLGDKHGPFWNPKYPNPNDNPVVKALAKEIQVADIDSETGEDLRRDATTADRFPNPYPNPTAAAAAKGSTVLAAK
jgi:ubiquinol-cytochrome c reductase cytochrome c1 subunit